MGKWKWMDEETSAKLEDVFHRGDESMTLEGEGGWRYVYDLKDMTQVSLPNDDTPPVTRAVQRVITEIHA